MKYKIFTALALAGSALAELLGGWDQALQTLVIFMAADWITGGILLPAVLFFVKYFSLKKASEFPIFSKGFSLLSAGIMHPCA